MIKERLKSLKSFKNLSLYSIFYGNLKKNNIPDTYNFNKNYNFEKIKKPLYNKLDSFTIKNPNKNEENSLIVFSYYCNENLIQ